ncbi:MAG: 1-(5-phosphoribosyl)-5-[(5-phosphoribosylamino)methylideneamino]imidazole-4-carboxamide isomerase [Clostridiaceae bacterium]|jgi:phosphoribosylformimino-5-aminoimidazole carboxamide ribotide isomerase|nr:1-(5-phosphoribosyl)-5-[(5-phosphoribosylamino)methylideneamino]imidazole-4-carboxamide isomerase [Clostridiaceae bacterium]
MKIYPAIDILDGKCVRLLQGEYDKSTVYSDDPAMMAEKWQQQGAQYLHLVDLDGARIGKPINDKTVASILQKVDIPIQLGGGIRTLDDIQMYINMGVTRLILGTSAVGNDQFIKKAISLCGEKIVVGIDAKKGFVATDGWENLSEYDSIQFAKKMESLGVKTIVYTDIATDGMLSGPNIVAMEKMVQSVTMEVIASGGVANAGDVDRLRKIGVSGVIIGKALYSGNINLKEILG